MEIINPETIVRNLILEKIRLLTNEDIEVKIDIPTPDKGDYAFACFPLAKILKKNPIDIAKDLYKELLKSVSNHKLIKRVEVINAYINFFIDWEYLFNELLDVIINNTSQLFRNKEEKKVLVEFSCPNANKPMHLGHLRNNALGESISRMLELSGNNVVRTNLMNDKGLSVFQALAAYIRYGNGRTPKDVNEKPDHFVGKYYLLYKQKEEELQDFARELLRKWEDNDLTVRKQWKTFTSWAIQGFLETYKVLGLRFDRIDYESEIYDKGKQLVLDALKKGLFVKGEDGEVIAPLSSFGLKDKVILRSDGTSLYITQDLYLAIKRYEEERFDKLIYVVGDEQDLHFKQLFAILKLLGYDWAKNLYHRSYGLILLEHGKMKSREGRVVDADDIINEMISLARKELEKRGINKDIEKDIGLSALNFYLLKYDPRKAFTYKPEVGISFDGETGPYIQYSFVRLKSILKKSKLSASNHLKGLNEKELLILRELWFLRNSFFNALEKLDPSIIAHSLIEFSQLINNYYHEERILGSENEEVKLLFIELVLRIMELLMKTVLVSPLDEM